MRVRRQFLLVLLAFVVIACQSGTTSTTIATDTTESSDETTGEVDEISDPGSVSSLGDLPTECVDALSNYLQLIEPVVEDFDFMSATMENFEVLSEEIATVTENFEEQTANCPELDQSAEDGLALIREFAAEQAPGTVPYFDFIQQFVVSFEGAGAASGDCETDIAAFREYVDRGGTMSDLTASEVAIVSTLMSTIAVACSDERFLEWQEDVGAWIEG